VVLTKEDVIISYVYMPNKSFIEKMYDILNKINTDYVAVCADDDFILEETTLKIITNLKEKKYVMGVGNYVGFDLPFKGFYNIYGKLPKINSNFASLRVVSYLSNYYMSLWAVYKKDTILKAYSILVKSDFKNHNLIELTIAINCAIEGKILFLDMLYGIREVNNVNSKNWAKEHKTIMSVFKNNYSQFAKEINNISINSSNQYLFKLGTYSYLIFSLKNKILNKKENMHYLKIEDKLYEVSKIILSSKKC